MATFHPWTCVSEGTQDSDRINKFE